MLKMPAPSSDPTPPATSAAATPKGRASWSGLLRLSLVAVPVKAYPANTAATESHCHQLHADCGQRIRYLKQCPIHGSVEAGAIVSGFPYTPDQYVVIDDDQLDQLRAPADRALCLEHFIDAEEFDPALFAGRTLYLWPDGVLGQYPYAVLSAALRQRQKWAVGRVVMAGHRRVIVVRPAGTLLAMHVLHFPAQVRSAPETESRPTPVSAAEQELAGQLIDANTRPVNWSDYRDDRAEQMAVLVQAALEQKPLTPVAAEPLPMLPLLEALNQSIAEVQRGSGGVNSASNGLPRPSANGAVHRRNGKRPTSARRRA